VVLVVLRGRVHADADLQRLRVEFLHIVLDLLAWPESVGEVLLHLPLISVSSPLPLDPLPRLLWDPVSVLRWVPLKLVVVVLVGDVLFWELRLAWLHLPTCSP
jgi:hypothetical protein